MFRLIVSSIVLSLTASFASSEIKRMSDEVIVEVTRKNAPASLVVFPIIIYFAVILGGIYIGKFDTEHTFFNSALFDISILNWLYIPILLILGGVPVFKHAWWGGWNGAVFMSIAAIFAVRFVAPELAPF